MNTDRKLTAPAILSFLFLHLMIGLHPVYATDLLTEPGSTISSYSSTSQLIGYKETVALLSEQSAAPETMTSGQTYYVSLSGSDSNNGNQTSAWRSLQYAVSKLQAGDTLYIMEGTYQETAVFNASGTADAYITVQGIGNVVIDGADVFYYQPVFDTNGKNYIQFRNLTVNNARAAVDINNGSHDILVENLQTDHTQMAVHMNNASSITIRNAYASNSRNAFQGDGTTHDVLMENITATLSKDIYPGYSLDFLNGDGFIFEDNTYNLTFRNIVSSDNWDAGFDIKGDNVLIENVISYGNKNGIKLWGNNVTVINALIYGNKRQQNADGTTVDGNGVNIRSGTSTFINCTIVDNEEVDFKVGNSLGTSHLENSIVASRRPDSYLLGAWGVFTQKNVLWYDLGHSMPEVPIPTDSLWADPGFVDWNNLDFHLKSTSVVIDKGVANPLLPTYDLDYDARFYNNIADFGAYEYQLPAINQPPVFSIPNTQATSEDQVLTFAVTASDPDNDSLTFLAAGLPEGSAFDLNTNIFSWTPTYDQAGTYQIIFSAFDGDLKTDLSVTLSVLNVDRAPVFQSLGDKSVDANNILIFTAQASDPDQDSVIYSASGLPTGATYDPNTQVFNWTPSASQAGTYSVIFSAFSGALRTDKVVNLTVISPAPPPPSGQPVLVSTINAQNYTSVSDPVTKQGTDTITTYGARTITYAVSAAENADYLFSIATSQFSGQVPSPGYQFRFNVYVDNVLKGNYSFSATSSYVQSSLVDLGVLSVGSHALKLEWTNDTIVSNSLDSNLGLRNLAVYKVPPPDPIQTALVSTINTQNYSWTSDKVIKQDTDKILTYGARSVAYMLNAAENVDYFFSIATSQFSGQVPFAGYQFKFNVYVDGVLKGNYSFSATSSYVQSSLIDLGVLSAGSHALQLEWTNDTIVSNSLDSSLGLKNLMIYIPDVVPGGDVI